MQVHPVRSKYSNVLKPWVDGAPRRTALGRRYATKFWIRVTLCYISVPVAPWTTRSARNHDWIQTDRVLLPYEDGAILFKVLRVRLKVGGGVGWEDASNTI